MTSEKREQKFHTNDASPPRSRWCFWLVVPRGKFASTNQKHYPYQGTDASSVWNFWALFSDVISQKKQWWRRQMSCLLRLVLFTTPKLTPGRWKLNPDQTHIRVHWLYNFEDEFKSALINWKDRHIFSCSFPIYQISVLTVIVNMPSPGTAFSKTSLGI